MVHNTIDDFVDSMKHDIIIIISPNLQVRKARLREFIFLYFMGNQSLGL